MRDYFYDTKYKKDMNFFFLERSAWILIVAVNTGLSVPRATLARKFCDSKPEHIPWHVILLRNISFLRSASHERKCSNCFPHCKKKKAMKITEPKLSCGKSSPE